MMSSNASGVTLIIPTPMPRLPLAYPHDEPRCQVYRLPNVQVVPPLPPASTGEPPCLIQLVIEPVEIALVEQGDAPDVTAYPLVACHRVNGPSRLTQRIALTDEATLYALHAVVTLPPRRRVVLFEKQQKRQGVFEAHRAFLHIPMQRLRSGDQVALRFQVAGLAPMPRCVLH